MLISSDASKPTRNGFVHPHVQYFSKLILLGAPLNCADANELLSTIKSYDPDRLHMVRVIVEHTDPVCFEDAKAD